MFYQPTPGEIAAFNRGKMAANLEGFRKALEEVKHGGLFNRTNPVLAEFYRGGILIDSDLTHNGITTGGKTSVLDIAFRNQTQIAAWYFGLVDNSGFTAVDDDTDTMSSHAGWDEFTDYDQTTRPAWGPTAAADASITNVTSVVFDINATGTLWGMLVTSDNVKGDDAGVLWSTAGFSVAKPVLNGDQVKLTYTLNC